MATPAAFGAGTNVTLGDAGTPTSQLATELVAQALTAKGFTVTRATFPTAAAADAAQRAGTLDVFVTDTSTLLERVLAQPKERNATTLTQTLTTTLAPRGQVPVAAATDDDAPQVACTRGAARIHKLRGVISLAKAAPRLTYAADAAHVVRADGLAALRATFRRVIVSPGNGRFDVIARGRAHCVLSSGTEPRAERLKLATLTDATRRLAGTPRNEVVVAAQSYLGGAPPTFTSTVQAATAAMTQPAIRGLRVAVELDGQDRAVAAGTFLRSVGLIP